MALVGYARVSSIQQDLTEQLEALKAFGCEKIFSGKHSGKAKDNQEQLNKMLDYIREGDTVVVTKVDRLGRSLNQVLNVLEEFKQQNIGFVAIQQNVDTRKQSDPLAMAMIQLLGIFAELERSFIVERTQEGIRAKREAGEKCGGRPAALSESKLKQFKIDAESGLSLSALGHKYKISRATAQRYRTSLKVNKGENYEN